MSVAEGVARHVREHIARQRLPRGTPLPSYRDLSAELGAALVTVKLGMDLLVEQGVVRRERARGCYVNRELAPQGQPLTTLGILHTASQMHLFTTPYLVQIMQGINGLESPLDIHIFTLREDGLITAAQLADHHVDGVILLGVENDAYLREFVTWGVPGVVVDYFARGIPLDFVACDNPSATRRAVQYLAGLGHRSICYVGSEPAMLERVTGAAERMETRSSDFLERHEAAVHAMAALGVAWKEAVMPRSLAQRAPAVGRLAAAWREDADRPTAFLADGEDLANSLISELVTRGVRVPDEVSVCTVASASERTDQGLALTGPRFDFVGMGRKAVDLLRWRCEQPAEALPPAVYRIGFEWIEGGTAARASGRGFEDTKTDQE